MVEWQWHFNFPQTKINDLDAKCAQNSGNALFWSSNAPCGLGMRLWDPVPGCAINFISRIQPNHPATNFPHLAMNFPHAKYIRVPTDLGRGAKFTKCGVSCRRHRSALLWLACRAPEALPGAASARPPSPSSDVVLWSVARSCRQTKKVRRSVDTRPRYGWCRPGREFTETGRARPRCTSQRGAARGTWSRRLF